MDGSVVDLKYLRCLLQEIEASVPSDALTFHVPRPKQRKFYYELCEMYRSVSPLMRKKIRQEIACREGVLNSLIAFMYGLIEEFRKDGNSALLMTALAAGSMRGDGPDYRDFYLVLAELFIAFEEAGLDPALEFNAMGGGIPTDFHGYAVVRSRKNQ